MAVALYRCEVKAISRGQGRSCVAAAAYRAGVKLRDERQQLMHSYERKKGITHSEIVAPENAPSWVHDRAQLWNRVDAVEKRRDAMTAREILLSLPRELDRDQQVQTVREFVQSEFIPRGIAADFAIHEPDGLDGKSQPHCHILVSDRPIDPKSETGLAAKKDRFLKEPSGIEALRKNWERCCNTTLERAGISERVDRRSLKAQRQALLVVATDNSKPAHEREAAEIQAIALDRAPEPKIGPVAAQMARTGRGGQAHAFQDALEVRCDRNDLVALAAACHQEQHERNTDLRREFFQALTERKERNQRSKFSEALAEQHNRGAEKRREFSEALIERQEREESVQRHEFSQTLVETHAHRSTENQRQERLAEIYARQRREAPKPFQEALERNWQRPIRAIREALIWTGIIKEVASAQAQRDAQRAAEKLRATLDRYGATSRQDRGTTSTAASQRRTEQDRPDIRFSHDDRGRDGLSGQGNQATAQIKSPPAPARQQATPVPTAPVAPAEPPAPSLIGRMVGAAGNWLAEREERKRQEAMERKKIEERQEEVCRAAEERMIRERYHVRMWTNVRAGYLVTHNDLTDKHITPGGRTVLFQPEIPKIWDMKGAEGKGAWAPPDVQTRLQPLFADDITAAIERHKQWIAERLRKYDQEAEAQRKAQAQNWLETEQTRKQEAPKKSRSRDDGWER